LTEYKLKAIEYVHGYFSSEQVKLNSVMGLVGAIGFVCLKSYWGWSC